MSPSHQQAGGSDLVSAGDNNLHTGGHSFLSVLKALPHDVVKQNLVSVWRPRGSPGVHEPYRTHDWLPGRWLPTLCAVSKGLRQLAAGTLAQQLHVAVPAADGAAGLPALASTFPSVQRLHLRCDLTDQAPAIGTALVQAALEQLGPSATLTALRLALLRAPAACLDAAALQQVVQSYSSLESLSLSANGVSPGDAVAVARTMELALGRVSSAQSALSGDALDSELAAGDGPSERGGALEAGGAAALAVLHPLPPLEPLQRLARLRHLALGCCMLSWQQLAWVASLTGLQAMELRSVALPPAPPQEDGGAGGEWLRSLRGLTRLHVSACGSGPQAAAGGGQAAALQVFSSLAALPALTVLELPGAVLGADEWRMLQGAYEAGGARLRVLCVGSVALPLPQRRRQQPPAPQPPASPSGSDSPSDPGSSGYSESEKEEEAEEEGAHVPAQPPRPAVVQPGPGAAPHGADGSSQAAEGPAAGNAALAEPALAPGDATSAGPRCPFSGATATPGATHASAAAGAAAAASAASSGCPFAAMAAAEQRQPAEAPHALQAQGPGVSQPLEPLSGLQQLVLVRAVAAEVLLGLLELLPDVQRLEACLDLEDPAGAGADSLMSAGTAALAPLVRHLACLQEVRLELAADPDSIIGQLPLLPLGAAGLGGVRGLRALSLPLWVGAQEQLGVVAAMTQLRDLTLLLGNRQQVAVLPALSPLTQLTRLCVRMAAGAWNEVPGRGFGLPPSALVALGRAFPAGQAMVLVADVLGSLDEQEQKELQRLSIQAGRGASGSTHTAPGALPQRDPGSAYVSAMLAAGQDGNPGDTSAAFLTLADEAAALSWEW